MEQVYSVSQVNYYIKNLFVKDYVLNHMYMKGEVSNCKYHTSGHIYFTLKDETGQMACVMFSGQRTGLHFRLEEGQCVIVHGSINVYERDGKYQMYAKEITLDGIGVLYERFEILKRKLEAEGLFDPEQKKRIPPFPKRIGIVTAKTGAAIHDIMNIAKRRNPFVQLLLYPAQVQGEGAAMTIVRGIKRFEKLGVDTIIIGRGGGSIEDLWAFNEEIVARAVFECQIPIISAVGHETDFTIADFASDLRAPTPSAAAELAVNDVSHLLSALVDYHYSLTQGMMNRIATARAKVEQYKLRLSYTSPMFQIRQKRQLTLDLQEKLERLMKLSIQRRRHLLELYIEKMKGLSPLDKLKKGYSYIEDANGRMINRISQVEVGSKLKISVTDGIMEATVTKKIDTDL